MSYNFRDADDAVSDLDGKDMQGGRVRVELARDPRDSRRDRGGGGFGRGGRDGRRGNPPGPKTNYRLVVENISSRTSWQVNISNCLLHIAYITFIPLYIYFPVHYLISTFIFFRIWKTTFVLQEKSPTPMLIALAQEKELWNLLRKEVLSTHSSIKMNLN